MKIIVEPVHQRIWGALAAGIVAPAACQGTLSIWVLVGRSRLASEAEYSAAEVPGGRCYRQNEQECQ